MSKAIIYGNGKSRLGFNVGKKYNDIITWGCNKYITRVKLII